MICICLSTELIFFQDAEGQKAVQERMWGDGEGSTEVVGGAAIQRVPLLRTLQWRDFF